MDTICFMAHQPTCSNPILHCNNKSSSVKSQLSPLCVCVHSCVRLCVCVFEGCVIKSIYLNYNNISSPGFVYESSVMILDFGNVHSYTQMVPCFCAWVCVSVRVCVCALGWISQMEGQESPDRIKPSTIWWPFC